MTEHIVATFTTQQAADAAVHELEDAGFPTSGIRRYRAEGGGAASRAAETTTATTSSTGGGFWAWLLGEEGTQTTRNAYPTDEEWYARRAGAGDTVVSVTVTEDSRIHQAIRILETHQPVEMDERTEEDGVSGASTVSDERISAGSAAPPIAGATAPGTDYQARPASHAAGNEEVIPLAEEDLEVGKRRVDRGTTRVRRYVVETPVEREVTLHGERVTIERRKPVDRSLPEGNAFEERTVEVHETEEVPVAQKSARVVEEVAIRKEETERTETVRDTVRREEVDVSSPTDREK
jgi:uncharacterized protein (TIGR02271 family)